jgi:cystine transport system ATP-binding protein
VAGVTAGAKPPLARALKGRVGFVFQSFNLFPHRTALQNVAEGPIVVRKAKSPPSRARPGPALLTKVGLAHRVDAYPRELSGGQQQRCAIARPWPWIPRSSCSTSRPRPWTRNWSARCWPVIRDLAAEKRTMVIVTHQMDFARDVADRTIFMDDGVIIEQGPSAEVLGSPKEERTRRFLSKVSGLRS